MRSAFDWFWSDAFPHDSFSFLWLEETSPRKIATVLQARMLGSANWRPGDWGEAGQRESLIAMATHPRWTLVIDEEITLAADDSQMKRLSADTRLLSTFRNTDLTSGFAYWDNGTKQVEFDPSEPDLRIGDRPDSLVPSMKSAGFPLDVPTASSSIFSNSVKAPINASFALAEMTTKVPFTANSLRSAKYTVAAVKNTSAGPDVIDRVPEIRPSQTD